MKTKSERILMVTIFLLSGLFFMLSCTDFYIYDVTQSGVALSTKWKMQDSNSPLSIFLIYLSFLPFLPLKLRFCKWLSVISAVISVLNIFLIIKLLPAVIMLPNLLTNCVWGPYKHIDSLQITNAVWVGTGLLLCMAVLFGINAYMLSKRLRNGEE